MNENKNIVANSNNNLLETVIFKLLPHWPIFLFFIIVCFIGAFAYLKLALPTYEATATLLVKDGKKGSDESRMIEEINVFGSKKIIENEIEVIRSRSLMKEVAINLNLCAPVSMDNKFRTISAYNYSPIVIEIKNPDNLDSEGDRKIYFSYDEINKLISIGANKYAKDVWVSTSYGELKFTANSRLKKMVNYPLFFTLVSPKNVVNGLSKKLNVIAANKLSSVVNLQFTDEVPERAEDILNELITVYNRAGINDKNALADNTMLFIDERLKLVKFELDSVEKQIQQYRSTKGAINLSEQGSLFLKNVGDNDQKLSQMDMQLAVLDQVQKFINSGQSIGAIVPSSLGISDPVLSQLLTKLSSTELEYEKLKNTTGENSPVLVSLSNELERIKPNILESIRIQRINLMASSKNLSQTNKKYFETLQSIPEKERKLLEISRQQTIINNVYDFLLKKKKETALSYASTVPDSRILDRAEASIKPLSPKKTVVLAIALVLSFILSFSIILIKESLSSKILFRSELNDLAEFPIVGEVTFIKEALKSLKSTNQQFFQVIASLGLLNRDSVGKKILVTSSTNGEGKSFISLNLAKSIADSGKKVILLDFDFINPTSSNITSDKKTPGLFEFTFHGHEAFDLICPTEFENLYLIKAGNINNGYPNLSSTARLEQLFSYLEQSFDSIIIDTSPIDPINNTIILSQYCDITLYVVRHRYTLKTIFKLQNQKKNLHLLKNIKFIFNGIKKRGFWKGYGFGYGYNYNNSSSEKSLKINRRVNDTVVVNAN